MIVGFIGLAALRPWVTRTAIELARAVDDHSRECDDPDACRAIVAAFIGRLERGDVTFRALAYTLFLRDRVRDGDAHLTPEEAARLRDWFVAVDVADGQPGEPGDYY